ncbi:hypothetical protein GCM10009743_65310 [Kribbella swartbergensis]
MGSGSWLLAQITGPAKDNGKGATGAGLNGSPFKPKRLSLTTRNAPGPQGPQALPGAGAAAPVFRHQCPNGHES